MALARGVTRMWSTAFERVGTHERRQILRRGFRLPTHAAWRARARAASSKADVKDYGLELPSFGSEDIEKARTCFDGSGERKVEWYPADAHPIAQATDELETRLGEDTVADRETLRWFVKERKLDVNAAEAKARKYDMWRKSGFENVRSEDVRPELATGKAELLEDNDVLGRPIVIVRLARHSMKERDLEDTKRLCVYLIDQALAKVKAEGKVETILCVFDMRGFSSENFDVDFLKFFIQVIIDYFPKRISQVLLLDAPPIVRPMWTPFKPLLGKYANIVRFVGHDEAESVMGTAFRHIR